MKISYLKILVRTKYRQLRDCGYSAGNACDRIRWIEFCKEDAGQVDRALVDAYNTSRERYGDGPAMDAKS